MNKLNQIIGNYPFTSKTSNSETLRPHRLSVTDCDRYHCDTQYFLFFHFTSHLLDWDTLKNYDK